MRMDDNIRQIWEWNGTVPEPVTSCIHSLIGERTISQPDSPAICSWDGELSYSELDELSTRLAGLLLTRGIGPEVLVPLCFEKSKWTIVSMLGVLKAGAGFVPLDPTQPLKRLEHVIRQTKCRLILSSDQYQEACKHMVDEVLVVNAESLQLLANPLPLPQAATPQSVAYVMFTSGSTGEPKGVIIEHEQLSTSATRNGQALGFDAKSRMLQFSSYTFDMSILEIFATLVHGGCVCVLSEWQRFNDLSAAIRQMKANRAGFTPSLLSTLKFEHLETLDTLIIGGESLPGALVKHWSSRLRLYSIYGPTECCIDCAIVDTHKAIPCAGDLGQAIASRLWISSLDSTDTLCPIGTAGELIIEGPLVGRGYLNDVEKTTASFIGAPTWFDQSQRKASTRFYRTGDIAKYNPDGSIRYLGRIDNQVKVRGQRLELGEVETHLDRCLKEHVKILESIVILAEPSGHNDASILIAFLRVNQNDNPYGYLGWSKDGFPEVASNPDQKQSLSSLAASLNVKLSETLPPYGVPSIFLPVVHFPLSVAGKIDRTRLRSIVGGLTKQQLVSFSCPNDQIQDIKTVPNRILSPAESGLRDLWADVLSINAATISPSDNFFWRGGDSVSAIGLVAAARSFGHSLTVADVFQNPTLSEMASTLQPLVENGTTKSVAPFALIDGVGNVESIVEDISAQCKVERSSIEDIYPCSPMQASLMALSIKEPGTYVLQMIYSLPASLDMDSFKAAWEYVSMAHPIMQTRFVQYPVHGLLQVVTKQSLTWHDGHGRSLDAYLGSDKKLGMTFGQPMSRFALLPKPDDQGFDFIWTVHHALMDGWSIAKVIDDVEKAYASKDLHPSPAFNAFINYLSGLEKEASMAFWHQNLLNTAPPTFPAFPNSSYRPNGNTSYKSRVTLSRQTKSSITTATMVKAAWSLLIGLYSNSEDVVTGVTLNGRTAHLLGIEDIVGPTLVTLPFRTQFQRDQTVNGFLKRVQKSFIDMVPFENLGLQDIKRLSPDAEAACGFRTLLVVQSTRERDQKLFSANQDYNLTMDYGLTLECELKREHINLRATYDSKLFPGRQIERIMAQFEQILYGLSSEDSSRLLSDVLHISESDMKDILDWNFWTPTSYEACVHELISQRVFVQPDRPAVCAWDGDLTYRELESLSNHLSAYLVATEGIGPETMVPICFEKSKWAVVSMLAVLKAGGAFVPIDPKHPLSRIETIVKDIGNQVAGIALTSVANSHLFEGLERTICIGPGLLKDIPAVSSKSITRVGPSNPAFIVYTSGSTGAPKGIVIEHQAACTSAREHGAVIRVGPDSRVFQFAAYTFDISLGDILVTLIHGGCVCIPSEDEKMNNIAGSMRAMNVNLTSLTSTVACHFSPEQVPSLETLVVAGEAMTKEVVERWADRVELINMYGPAECTIYCVGQPGIRRANHSSLIGRGVGALTWIADPNDPNILSPIGAVGELLIEGPTLARGYLNKDDLTRSAFLENPSWLKGLRHTESTPRRVYRTGDLVRYFPDGALSFVGRKDDGQTKLRGQRLELGEVEYQLRASLPDCVDVAAAVAALQNGQPRLVAFITVREADDSHEKNGYHVSRVGIASTIKQIEYFKSVTSGLESKLASVLPSYMIPSILIPMTTLPMTMSSKVDRRRLDQLAAGLTAEQLSTFRGQGKQHLPPTTSMERRLAQLWQKLLQAERVGKDDSFLQLGGDSVTAMRLVGAARTEGLSLTVDKVFKNPVLADMAAVTSVDIGDENRDVPPFSLIPAKNKESVRTEASLQCDIPQSEIEDIYPCTPQQIFWIDDGVRKHEHQAQSVYSLAKLDVDRFRRAWEAVCAAHEILRTRIVRTTFGHFNVVTKASIEWQHSTSLHAYLAYDRPRLIAHGERLQRFCIVDDERLGDRYFVLTQQHSSYDGWSLQLMFQELAHAYREGVSTAVGAKYSQFIKTISSYDQQAAKDYWTAHVAGVETKPLLAIPEGHVVFPDSYYKRRIKLTKPQGSNITIGTMIEAAWAIVFQRILGTKDVMLDILRAGRTTPVPGVEELIAAITTACPFRVSLDPQQRIQNLLETIQTDLTDMTPFEHLGFFNIAALSPELTTACKNSIRVNIAPPVATNKEAGSALDLPLIWAELFLGLPLRLDVVLPKEGVVDAEAVFDNQLFNGDWIDKLLCRFELALRQIAVAGKETRIQDVDLNGIVETPCVRIDSIGEESKKVRGYMLVSPSLLLLL